MKDKIRKAVKAYQSKKAARELSKEEREAIYKLMAATGYTICLLGDLESTSIYRQKLKNTAVKFLKELEFCEDRFINADASNVDIDIVAAFEQMEVSYNLIETFFDALFSVNEANQEALNDYILKGIDKYKTPKK